ncbi:hypothetical protein [Zhongshania aquimaris]|uniref:Uncharacterized protein n=1 Tax=Zhongshania aquimaris TaxID=2857107 RepID=A0ABS6VLI3_9GAMM|nr:hypothetical protein [Zhongshania aquimaris]MBW2939170.1 hypothetical protein [Zhongshania aquimaris]
MSQNRFQVKCVPGVAPICRLAGICSFSVCFLLVTPAYANEEADLPVVKLTPQIRIEPSQNRDFTELPCEELAETTAENAVEQRILAERKQACLTHYQQFIPNKGLK